MEPVKEFYFKEPLLEMPMVSRKAISFITAVWSVILVAAAATFLLSGTAKLFWPGLLISLYLTHRLFHFNDAKLLLSKVPLSGKINTADYLNRQSVKAITLASDRSLLFGGDFSLHLISELSQSKEVREALLRLDVNYDEFREKLGEHLKKSVSETKQSHNDIILKIRNLALSAINLSLKGGGKYVDDSDLFAAIGDLKKESVEKIFNLFQIDSDNLERALIFGRFRRRFFWHRLPTSLGGFVNQPYKLRHRIMNRAWTARPTPTLDLFGVDFTDMARASMAGFLVGHEKEYDRILDILSRPNQPNALLIGEAGAGKEALVGHLAYEIIHDKVPPQLFDKRLVTLDLNSLLAGADVPEQQARIKKIFEEINRAGNIILYIPDIHNLSRTAGRYELNIINTIIPFILSNDFPTIGSTYPKESKQFIESQSSFAQAFQFIQVDEITPSEAELVLTYDSLILEEQYKVKITYGAIKKAVEVAYKYFRQRLLPSSADDLLKEALAEAAHCGDKALSADDIIAIAEKRTNVPLKEAGYKEREKLLHLEELIHERLIDQEAAVSAVSKILREYRSGLASGKGPIGSFLFVGPTGVGKTELSKILAKIQFGSEDMMVRFDMSEYQDKASFYRFIGSPDGEITGALTDAVLQKPYALILLDEFEKAHPDVLNLFLQVFDDGRLTDNLGRMADFKNTIIIATSNAESNFIKEEIDKGRIMESVAEELKKRLIHYFKPELLNRMQTIVFKNLSMEDIIKITGLLMNDLGQTLAKQGIKMKVEDGALRKIAELGFSPAYGARPLRGVISNHIKSPLSEMILKGEISRGGEVIISLKDGGIKIAALIR